MVCPFLWSSLTFGDSDSSSASILQKLAPATRSDARVPSSRSSKRVPCRRSRGFTPNVRTLLYVYAHREPGFHERTGTVGCGTTRRSRAADAALDAAAEGEGGHRPNNAS